MYHMNINKIIYAIFIIFSCFFIKANAQMSIGFDAGMTFNKLNSEYTNENIKLIQETGYITSILLQYDLNKRFTIELTPSLLQKNYAIKNKSEIRQAIINTYLQFPVNAKYNIRLSSKFIAFGSLGVYYAYWLNSQITGTEPNIFDINQALSFNNQSIKLQKIRHTTSFNIDDERSEFGWVGKTGLDYCPIKNVTLSFKGHLYQSLTSQQKETVKFQKSKSNQTLAVNIGLSYTIN